MKACILSVSGEVLTDKEASLFRDQQPWAIILMGRSCRSKIQVRKLVDDIWSALGRSCLIFIDQEGGRVARLKAPEWPLFPAAVQYGKIFEQNAAQGLEACRIAHSLIGLELSDLGIHADCSPVVDLPQPGAHDIIGDRAFSSDPLKTGKLAAAALAGLSDAGVSGVIKHITGHGRSRSDSHDELPVIIDTISELSVDFEAFRLVRHAPMAMTAHILFTELDTVEPVTTSASIINDVIRQRIGFDNLLMSDDLGMKALGGPLAERAVKSLNAGCDVVLHCSGFEKDPDVIYAEMSEVAEASSELVSTALGRARRAEYASTNTRHLNRGELWSRFGELMGVEVA
jgi:beta-N-acetylhexosaminidase